MENLKNFLIFRVNSWRRRRPEVLTLASIRQNPQTHTPPTWWPKPPNSYPTYTWWPVRGLIHVSTLWEHVSLSTFNPKSENRIEPNLTEMSVFSVVRFGFGFGVGELRLRLLASVLVLMKLNTRINRTAVATCQHSKSHNEASA